MGGDERWRGEVGKIQPRTIDNSSAWRDGWVAGLAPTLVMSRRDRGMRGGQRRSRDLNGICEGAIVTYSCIRVNASHDDHIISSTTHYCTDLAILVKVEVEV